LKISEHSKWTKINKTKAKILTHAADLKNNLTKDQFKNINAKIYKAEPEK